MLKALKLSRYGSCGMAVPRSMEWSELKRMTIKNRNVIITGFEDVCHFGSDAPVFLAEKLFVVACHPDFTCDWVTLRNFPHVKELYLLTDPYPYVLLRDFPRIYIASN